jgi:chromosome condensin MukBEF ATPase and DNA-binding subunit MukB
MDRVSSVTAFLRRYLEPANIDAEAQEVLAHLSLRERRLLELLASTRQEADRLQHLTRETGEVWTVEKYRHAEGRALSRLRQELDRRSLLQP